MVLSNVVRIRYRLYMSPPAVVHRCRFVSLTGRRFLPRTRPAFVQKGKVQNDNHLDLVSLGNKPAFHEDHTHRRDQDEPVIPPQSHVGHPPGHQPQSHGEEREGEEDAEDGVHFRRLGRVEICFRLGCHVRRRTGTETSRGRDATRWISCTQCFASCVLFLILIRVPHPP